MTSSAIDLSRLDPPDVIRRPDWEADIALLVADLSERLPEWRGVFTGDSFRKVCLAWANRLALKDEQHNNDARQMLLAYSTGGNLEHLAATYHRVQRLDGESNDELRARSQTAPEARAIYGLPEGAYAFRARTNFGAELRGIKAIHRGKGRVELRLLGKGAGGAVSGDLVVRVHRHFAGEDGSGSTDVLSVLPAIVEDVPVEIRLTVPRGPDVNVLLAASLKQLQSYADAIFNLDVGLYTDALLAAARVPSVITAEAIGLPGHILARPEVALRLVVTMLEPQVIG